MTRKLSIESPGLQQERVRFDAVHNRTCGGKRIRPRNGRRVPSRRVARVRRYRPGPLKVRLICQEDSRHVTPLGREVTLSDLSDYLYGGCPQCGCDLILRPYQGRRLPKKMSKKSRGKTKLVFPS